MGVTKSGTVKETGASAGDVLVGINTLNQGLRVSITKDHKVGHGGRIVGNFKVLSAGTGTYAEHIKNLEGREFENAKEIVDLVKKMSGENCSHIVNGNNFMVAG